MSNDLLIAICLMGLGAAIIIGTLVYEADQKRKKATRDVSSNSADPMPDTYLDTGSWELADIGGDAGGDCSADCACDGGGDGGCD